MKKSVPLKCKFCTQCCGSIHDFVNKTLSDAKCGSVVEVSALKGEGALRRRIMDMGITKGCKIYVRKKAPLGDPLEITVRGYELALRKADAALIEIV